MHEGTSSVYARGVCWSLNQNPTIDNDHTINDDGLGYFESLFCGLYPGASYYLRAYATNSGGTSYGEQLVFNTLSFPNIGRNYGGGRLAYKLGADDPGYDPCNVNGLVVGPQPGYASWGCEGTLIGGTSTGYITGADNTASILAGCGTDSIAARLCNDLVYSGYNDWYLPSWAELRILYINAFFPGGSSFPTYWSSSE